MDTSDRREFLRQLAVATGAVVVLPSAISCTGGSGEQGAPATDAAQPNGVALMEDKVIEVPLAVPADWDPVVFNRERGNAGAIPEFYLDDINGPDGVPKHLGKHLPYVPAVDASLVPEGHLALMWGDPDKGYAMHPQSPEGSEAYPVGHWFNWIRVRKAVDGDAEEEESAFTAWPESAYGDTGHFVAADGGDITADSGKHTVYLVKLPADVAPGDTVRIYGHCLYHGEYVDFLTV
jgi:hypothetical protein